MKILKNIDKIDDNKYGFIIVIDKNYKHFDLYESYEDPIIQLAQKEIKEDLKNLDVSDDVVFGNKLKSILNKYAPFTPSYFGLIMRSSMEKLVLDKINLSNKTKLDIFIKNTSEFAHKLIKEKKKLNKKKSLKNKIN